MEAAEAALAAVSYAHPLPLGHFYLGLALARMRQFQTAALALETSLRLRPGIPAVHRALACIYRRFGELQRANEHDAALIRTRLRQDTLRTHWAEIRRTASERARARRSRLMEAANAKKAKSTARSSKLKSQGNGGAQRPRMEFLIVSGLPRSGTSLMMQMLVRGGVPIMTDGHRGTDEDNPQGYYEWETIKKLPQRPEILQEAKGKALKVISALLPALPRRHSYKIIFMDRPIGEVVASQMKMIARRRTSALEMDRQRMAQLLDHHRRSVLQWLERASNVRLLRIDYAELVKAPEQFVPAIVECLGHTNIPCPNEMAGAVRIDLHRNRVLLAEPSSS